MLQVNDAAHVPEPSSRPTAAGESAMTARRAGRRSRSPPFGARPVRCVYVLAAFYAALAVVPMVIDGVRERSFRLRLARVAAEDLEQSREERALARGAGGENAARPVERKLAVLAERPADLQSDLLEALAHYRTRVWEGEYWRLITSTFLHAGVLHLGFNVIFLIYLGRVVERWIGPGRFLAAVLISALAGALVFQAVSGGRPGVGASGGIYGLLGMVFVLYCGLRSATGNVLGRRFWVFALIAVALMVLDAGLARVFLRGIGQGDTDVALSAHFGGFACGIFIGYLAYLPRGRGARGRRTAAWALLVTLFAGTAVYGIRYPVFDWLWYTWRAEQALEAGERDAVPALYQKARTLGGDAARADIVRVEVDAGDLEEALRQWRVHPIGDPELAIAAGHGKLYDALVADGRVEESEAVLDDLIELSDISLRKERSPDHLNNAAWFRALRGKELELALRYASEACREGNEPAYTNTLGWVQLQLGDVGSALKNLYVAADQMPSGPHYFYLALARWKAWIKHGPLTSKGEVLQLVETAFLRGGLMEHQVRILEEIERSLRSG